MHNLKEYTQKLVRDIFAWDNAVKQYNPESQGEIRQQQLHELNVAARRLQDGFHYQQYLALAQHIRELETQLNNAAAQIQYKDKILAEIMAIKEVELTFNQPSSTTEYVFIGYKKGWDKLREKIRNICSRTE